ncbi:MAG: hypothetical protein Q7W51_04640 [Coriobacteriia bacterium]|nr:hypothetical protein [Coriobacteriia bacterium]
MRPGAQTAGITLAVLLCLVTAGIVALVVMGAGPYLLIFLLGLREDWQMIAAVAATWFIALAPIIAAVCVVARAVALRGESTAGIMLGVAAYPALCLALVLLTPESLMEVRWIGLAHGFVAIPVALGVAVIWALIRPGGRLGAVRPGTDVATAAVPRWRPTY